MDKIRYRLTEGEEDNLQHAIDQAKARRRAKQHDKRDASERGGPSPINEGTHEVPPDGKTASHKEGGSMEQQGVSGGGEAWDRKREGKRTRNSTNEGFAEPLSWKPTDGESVSVARARQATKATVENTTDRLESERKSLKREIRRRKRAYKRALKEGNLPSFELERKKVEIERAKDSLQVLLWSRRGILEERRLLAEIHARDHSIGGVRALRQVFEAMLR